MIALLTLIGGVIGIGTYALVSTWLHRRRLARQAAAWRREVLAEFEERIRPLRAEAKRQGLLPGHAGEWVDDPPPCGTGLGGSPGAWVGEDE